MAAARPRLTLRGPGRREDLPDLAAGWAQVLQPPHRAWQRRLWRLVLTTKVRLFERGNHRRLTLEHVAGVPIVLLPDVFNPRLFRTGQALARYLRSAPLPPGARVLDLGTGSGIGALVAAARGGEVVATDITPEAVRCARINALLNGLETRIEVRQGDLFEPVRGERFDLVLCNPPYFPGRPRDAWEHAWRSDDLLERFAAGLADVLRPDGRALVILSSDMAEAAGRLARPEQHWRVAWQRDLINERLVILEGARTPTAEGAP